MATQILAAGQAAANSSAITLADGEEATIRLFSSAPIVAEKAVFEIHVTGVAGTQIEGTLNAACLSRVISGAGEYVVKRPDISAYGQDIGVQRG